MIVKKRRLDTMTLLVLLVVVGVVATEFMQGILLNNQPVTAPQLTISTAQQR